MILNCSDNLSYFGIDARTTALKKIKNNTKCPLRAGFFLKRIYSTATIEE